MVESVVEKCIECVGNRFKLALLASQRTRDLNTGTGINGRSKFKGHKNTVISLYEIAEKHVGTLELFSIFVRRCREYMRESFDGCSSSYTTTDSKLERILDFSDGRLSVNSCVDQESIGILDSSVDKNELCDKSDDEFRAK